jgi:hypothetical protein
VARKPRIDQRAIDRHLKDIAKGYERAARRNPIRVPIQTDANAEGVSMAGRDAVEGNPILARLLMWLDGQAQLDLRGRRRTHGDRHTSIPAWNEPSGGGRAGRLWSSNGDGELACPSQLPCSCGEMISAWLM